MIDSEAAHPFCASIRGSPRFASNLQLLILSTIRLLLVTCSWSIECPYAGNFMAQLYTNIRKKKKRKKKATATTYLQEYMQYRC